MKIRKAVPRLIRILGPASHLLLQVKSKDMFRAPFHLLAVARAINRPAPHPEAIPCRRPRGRRAPGAQCKSAGQTRCNDAETHPGAQAARRRVGLRCAASPGQDGSLAAGGAPGPPRRARPAVGQGAALGIVRPFSSQTLAKTLCKQTCRLEGGLLRTNPGTHARTTGAGNYLEAQRIT
jgi:hypothetical protein